MIRKLLRREIRREVRNSYTDLIVAGLETTVAGTDADALVTGALEAAAGLWGRTLAAATVTGTDALTARVRHRIGRDIVRIGESVFEIRTGEGRAMLDPASHWEVLEGWRYRLDFQVPPGKLVQRTVPRGRVAHFMWSCSPRDPWRGLSPLTVASKLGTLAARVEDKLAQDLNAPVAHLVPVPADGGDSALDLLRTDIGNAEGGAVLAEATSTGWDEDRNQSGTRHDWKAERLGPMIPDSLLAAWKEVTAVVSQACGIPSSLTAASDSDGTQLREDYRRFVMQSVEPTADMIAETASEALEVDVAFDFAALHAHDIQGRAAALAKLTAAGIPADEARRLVGLA